MITGRRSYIQECSSRTNGENGAYQRRFTRVQAKASKTLGTFNLVRRFINVHTYWLGRQFLELVFGIACSHPREQSVQVGASELPFERMRDAFVVALETR